MKKCIYCGIEHEEDVETCCGFSEFEPVEKAEVKHEEENIDDQEKEIQAQPAAHELLSELVCRLDIDFLEINNDPVPDWINDIPYDDVKLQAKNRWFEEHPTLVTRIKKYLDL